MRESKKMCRFHLYGLEWWTCSLILWHQTSSSLQRMPWESKGTYPANLSWSKATLNKAVRPYFPGGVALRGALKIPWTSNCRSYPTFFHMHVFFKILGAKDVKISLWLLQKETYCPPWTQIEATFDLGLENLAILTPPKSDDQTRKTEAPFKNKQPAPQMNFRICHCCFRRSLNSICGRRKPPRTLDAPEWPIDWIYHFVYIDAWNKVEREKTSQTSKDLIFFGWGERSCCKNCH